LALFHQGPRISENLKLLKVMNAQHWADSQRTVLLLPAVFAVVGLLLQMVGASQVLTALLRPRAFFLQGALERLAGTNPFESTLSSQLSTNVIHAESCRPWGSHRPSQHFTPILLLWSPAVAVVLASGPFPLVQVGGLDHRRRAGACNRLARNTLVDPRWRPFRGLQLLRRNAVIGPNLGQLHRSLPNSPWPFC